MLKKNVGCCRGAFWAALVFSCMRELSVAARELQLQYVNSLSCSM